MSLKPRAIIFGGINSSSRALAQFLVPLDAEPLVSHLRIVDKYSVAPPTTYLGTEFKKVLENPLVEYRQANLTVPTTVAACYDPPEGQEPYDYVFDLCGELQWDRPEKVQINTTFRVALHVAQEAARRKVKAYVRISHPFYEGKEKGAHDEKEDVKPDGVLGTWWHETLRALGAIPDLNLVIVRTALAYGPYADYSSINYFAVIAAVYGHKKEQMKGLWSPGKHPLHTVHVEDVAGAMFACAEWMARVGGRKEADALAGVEIQFKNDKSKVAEVEGMVPYDQKITAPLFNIEDDSKTSMHDIATLFTAYFGTTFGYYGFVADTMAKFKLEDMIEEINEEHVGHWTQMITSSNPPVPNTHFSAYADYYTLKKHVVAYNADKIKEIVGYKLRRPYINNETIKEIIDKLIAEGSWPNMDS